MKTCSPGIVLGHGENGMRRMVVSREARGENWKVANTPCRILYRTANRCQHMTKASYAR
jgi:hypothetical protein